ncbi:MAG: hypothetical protein IT370_13300 [Deltaproteobacteria bacterium]|nr:hypothetical protein [Deltaproteobacteria bacterium]
MLMITLGLYGCVEMPQQGPAPVGGEWQNLAPVPNPNKDLPRQPLRGHPFAVTLARDGQTAFVALRGNETEPQDEVVVLDVAGRAVIGKLQVGARPVAIVLRPQGDYAVVLSEFSPFAAVLDVARRSVVGKLEVGRYAQDAVFSADGGRMWMTSRMEDAVVEWQISAGPVGLTATRVRSAPCGNNPDGLGLSPDGSKLYVTDAGGMGVHSYDVATLTEQAFIFLNAPVFDVEPMGKWVVALTLNDSNGLPCDSDGDYPGVQGDGIFAEITDRTCTRGFADLQNEIAFIDPATDQVAIRYTSDSAYASEADREGDYDLALQKVVGSNPQRIVVLSPTQAYVAMSTSFELVSLSIDAGSPPVMTMEKISDTGFFPRGLAVTADGKTALTANKLSEDVSFIDIPTRTRKDIAVGHATPRFPATSAETGEFMFHTSRFASDGDMSCTHCHPNVENDGKGWNVDVARAYGRRSAMMMRDLFETKPLLIEGVFDEYNFNLELEGISLRADFHDSSYTLQVQRRNEFYRKVSRELLGREIDFDQMAEHIGDFLVSEPRLLPSPFDKTTPEVERGKALFFRADVGCAACHPAPTFASKENFRGVTSMGLYDRPRRDLDPDISTKFIENARDGFFNANTLRGLWDRKGALFHDGRARTIRETLLTPGHACLQPGERAFNEADGQVDTNGGISQLTCGQLDDLVAFLKTID